MNGIPITGPGVDRGVVFQSHNLFPWRTVRQNIEFGLVLKGISTEQRKEIVSHYLDLMGLSEFADVYPRQLSEGMQQRVGLARAYANDPRVLLMDEPFASLDAQTSARMRALLLEIWGSNRKTVVFVTHDIDEAIQLGDRILVLSQRPSRVKEEFRIDLPRPRSVEYFADGRYIELRKQLVAAVLSRLE
jgi:NitT/TauT family transport system ATP-binding protein